MIVLYLLLLFVCKSVLCSTHPLLSTPKRLTTIHLKELSDNWSYTWNWHFVDQGEVEFHYSHKKAGFIVRFFNTIPEEFRYKNYISKSEVINGKEIAVFEYVFGHIITESNEYEEYRDTKYVCDQTLAQKIDIIELSSVIKDKKIAFYTGAGISAAADIKTLDQLEKSLGVDRADFFCFVRAVFKKPRRKAFHFKKFAQSITEKAPTQAHISLTNIAQHKSTQILTENIDLLHQKTGIEPLCLLPSRMNELTNFEILKEVDAIICIGMSRDNVGFLEQYKQKNKKGIIIALDVKHPNYIGKGDFFIEGDAQSILPAVEKLVCKES